MLRQRLLLRHTLLPLLMLPRCLLSYISIFRAPPDCRRQRRRHYHCWIAFSRRCHAAADIIIRRDTRDATPLRYADARRRYCLRR